MTDLNASKLAEWRHDRAIQLIEGIKVLPTTVDVPMRVLALQRAKTAGLADFASVISNDGALASRLIALANSSYFSPTRPITKLTIALSMIGLGNVIPMVFSLSLAGVFNRLSLPPSEIKSWTRLSMFKGITAKHYAMKYGPEVAEEATLAGLLQDVALPVLFAADQAASPALSEAITSVEEAGRWRERALFTQDHAYFSGKLLAHLGLPKIFQQLASEHHQVNDSSAAAPADALTSSQRFAALLPHRSAAPLDPGAASRMNRLLIGAGFPEADRADYNKVLTSAAKEYGQITATLGDHDEGGNGWRTFMQSVTLELTSALEITVGHSPEVVQVYEQRQAEMERDIADLRGKARTVDNDPLTGSLNRRGFTTRVSRLLTLTRSKGLGCALGFADVDNFKRLNDTAGHSAGDAALRSIAATIQGGVARNGVVGRLGGDEFAFLIVGHDEKQLLEKAALVCGSLAIAPPTPGYPPITLSTGVFWIGIPTETAEVEELLRRADALMYEAKRSGKAKCVTGSIATEATSADEPIAKVA